jgi:hypothetical protein
MSKNLYKIAWFLSPVVFLVFFFYKGSVCLMGSCLGNNNEGAAWGIGAVIVYWILLKLARPDKKGTYWDVNGVKSAFFFYLLILIVIFVYYLGKINS